MRRDGADGGAGVPDDQHAAHTAAIDATTDGDVWVFAYGSLMWRPGFDYLERHRATLVGFRRCFCIYSVHHRGSSRRPGLVLGLDRGGNCVGVAYRIAAAAAPEVLAYLTAREQINGVYRKASVPVGLDRGDVRFAMCFIAERAHPSYTGPLSISRQARIIRAASGQSGSNFDYLANTLCHLQDLGIRERELEAIATLCGPVFSRRELAPSPPGEPDEPARRQTARMISLARALAAKPVDAPRMPTWQRRRFLYRIA